ncbi:MAG: type II secretion system F family protein [Synergistaceae bacterium]|nr:type II secretion system F family protein [Synergistaceae bacterium]
MNFKYRARSSDGEIIEGWIEAADQKAALESLRSRGMIVINLTVQGNFTQPKSGSKKKGGGGFSWKSILQADLGAILSGGRVPTKNLMVFFRQLATMENAGLGLASAVNMIAEQEKNQTLKSALMDIKSRLDRGSQLSQAMAQHKAFNALLVSLVEAGEEGGMLARALEEAAVLLEKQEALRSKIRSALFYPGFVMTFAVLILVFFFMFLVPKFKEVFSTLSIELPSITVIMFGMGDWFAEKWYFVAAIAIAIIGGWQFLCRNKSTRPFMDRLKLKIPVMKDLILKASMARSSRTLSALTSAGVPIVRSIEMAEGTAGNEAVKDGYIELRKSVVRGVSLGDAAKQAGIFPVLVSQMMRIGEETGHLDTMLERVATWYDQELDEQVKATVSLLEPMMIVFVGAIIAVIAVSIFAPITSSIVQLS